MTRTLAWKAVAFLALLTVALMIYAYAWAGSVLSAKARHLCWVMVSCKKV